MKSRSRTLIPVLILVVMLFSLIGCNRERPAPTPAATAAAVKAGTATPAPPAAGTTRVVLPGQTPQTAVVAPTPTVPASPAAPTPAPIATSAAPTPPIQPGGTGGATGETIHVVERGDTLAKIAARYGVTVQQIADLNGITNPNLIYTGQKLRIPAAGAAPTAQPGATRTYTVRAGDTLVSIATKFGVTVQAIQQLNNLPSPDKIYTGQVLKIP